MDFRIIPSNPARLLAAGVWFGMSAAALADTPFGVVGSPIDISAYVQESILPGGTVFEESKPLFGTQPDPKQSAELLHLASRGLNVSGRSTNIQQAFASSLAESDGNGGVGVTSWLAGNPGSPTENVVGQLAARSMWTQTFLYNGTPAVDISLHLHIPALEVALIGVAPNRDAPSATETASAVAAVSSLITHADGSFSRGADFQFGLKAAEYQYPLGPGNFANYGDVSFVDVGTGSPAVDLFKTFSYNRDGFNPVWSVDSVSASVKLGTLKTGDILSYVYTLSAQGTTHGGEHGYDAFLGDPFGIDIVGGNLVPEVTLSVPEPGSAALLLVGLGWLAWRRGGLRR
jgi:hypothetical protein